MSGFISYSVFFSFYLVHVSPQLFMYILLQVKDAELCVFFRNNHFNTLYKHKEELFMLVTDQGFLTGTHSHILTDTHTGTHSHILTHTHTHTHTGTHSHILTDTHTGTHSHILTHTHSHTHTHTHTGTHSHILTHTHTHSHTLTQVHTQTYSHTHTLTHKHTHTHTHTYTHSHTLKHTHTHTHTHKHTCSHTHTGPARLPPDTPRFVDARWAQIFIKTLSMFVSVPCTSSHINVSALIYFLSNISSVCTFILVK